MNIGMSTYMSERSLFRLEVFEIRQPRKVFTQMGQARVSSIGGLRTPAPVRAAPPSWVRHPKTFTRTDIGGKDCC